MSDFLVLFFNNSEIREFLTFDNITLFPISIIALLILAVLVISLNIIYSVYNVINKHRSDTTVMGNIMALLTTILFSASIAFLTVKIAADQNTIHKTEVLKSTYFTSLSDDEKNYTKNYLTHLTEYTFSEYEAEKAGTLSFSFDYKINLNNIDFLISEIKNKRLHTTDEMTRANEKDNEFIELINKY